MRTRVPSKKITRAQLLKSIGCVISLGPTRFVEFQSDDAEKLSEDSIRVGLDLSLAVENFENEQSKK